MPIKKWGTGDLFIVDTKTGECSKLSTIEESELSELSKEEMDRNFNNAPVTFDCKILNTTGLYIAFVYGNITYLHFPKKLKRSRKYREVQKSFRRVANFKRRIKNERPL